MITNVPSIGVNEVIVTLSGVADRSRATVSLANINNAGVSATASVGFLLGDVDNTFLVDANDSSSVKVRSGQATTAANFRFDLNTSGAINASDISAAKTRLNMVLP